MQQLLSEMLTWILLTLRMEYQFVIHNALLITILLTASLVIQVYALGIDVQKGSSKYAAVKRHMVNTALRMVSDKSSMEH